MKLYEIECNNGTMMQYMCERASIFHIGMDKMVRIVTQAVRLRSILDAVINPW